MQSATAIQNFPAVFPNLKPRAATSTAAATSAASTTDTSSGSANNLQSTFLNLLSQELQNQDPTDPVDSTQMVGQMISLNQLDQLIGINQILSKAATDGAAASVASAATSTAASKSAHSSSVAAASTAPPSSLSARQQLPFNPATMMPWNFSDPGAMAPLPGAQAAGQTGGNAYNLNAGGR